MLGTARIRRSLSLRGGVSGLELVLSRSRFVRALAAGVRRLLELVGVMSGVGDIEFGESMCDRAGSCLM